MTEPRRKPRQAPDKLDHLEHFRGDGPWVKLTALFIWKLPLILTALGGAAGVFLLKWWFGK